MTDFEDGIKYGRLRETIEKIFEEIKNSKDRPKTIGEYYALVFENREMIRFLGPRYTNKGLGEDYHHDLHIHNACLSVESFEQYLIKYAKEAAETVKV